VTVSCPASLSHLFDVKNEGKIISVQLIWQHITCKRGSSKDSFKDDHAFLFGNMRLSGTCPAETPQMIKMKTRTIDYVGKVTRRTKIGWNKLAGGGPTDR
jgi:hypothetical protein